MIVSARAAALVAVVLFAGACDRAPPAPTAKNAPKASAATPSKRPLTPAWPVAATGGAEDKTAAKGSLFARNYYVVLDASGSMNDASGCSGGQVKLEAARKALAAFADSVPADANLALQVFDRSGIREWLPLATGNRDRFHAALGNVRASGGTPLRDAIDLAYRKLAVQGAKQFGYGEYHLVVLTDGEANVGQDPVGVVDEILARSPVVFHTVGFCIGTEHSLNQPGRTLYRAADNAEQLRQRLGDVLAEAPVFDSAQFK